ncbi:MAG: ORC1-type DNA replication protein [Candidatus Methanoliparum thermophilum]|uniref:ORC1-type DNA replication protein n=2 Tax=Candidatus Methanoliparum TaxID=2545692 RepID=A0A520KT34_METT2|nr:ORC1-type DNA replication protein [Candidatus Methanoliparum sp. LAM-1]RZN65087.1 MAG: ORC1-type DNA replication protein [Candidatus Methanoliparum thermophilum]BDC36020.1 cell division control protein Cdc6 [Candidatus Methanoliparum sp. LAM-1]
MGNEFIKDMFNKYLYNKSLFKNKEVLSHAYIPENLLHRDRELEDIVSIIIPTIRQEVPSNIFIFGKPGTGKTACVKHIGKELNSLSIKKDLSPSFLYINCEMVDTQYRVLSNLLSYYGENVPLAGWPTDKLYNKFIECIEKKKQIVIIGLDEIDKLVKKGGDDLLYNLSRINGDLTNSKVVIIGISNDLKFIKYLDSRTLSSLGHEEIVFPPYNAEQLRDILDNRAKIAFDKEVLLEEVVPLCAAFAAQEHGDARKALNLLRMAGEIAERNNDVKITEEHVRKGKEKLEIDGTTEVIKTLPVHSKILIYSILLLEKCKTRGIITSEVYSLYERLCGLVQIERLTYRRISDLISELEIIGLINTVLISKGRYGRTKNISLAVDTDTVERAIQDDDRIKSITRISHSQQITLTNHLK